MFIGLLLAVACGLALGIATGLVPGIHPNTVFALVLAAPAVFTIFSPYAAIAFIVSLAISNTFFDFIPSILFGAPEEDSILSVLPGHKMLLEGRGYEAVFLTVMGGLGVVLLTVATLPLLFLMVPVIHWLLRPIMHIILIAAVLWMVLTEKRRLTALAVFLLAGLFGFMSLNSFPSDFALFPALTGLFGISTIMTSLMSKATIPEQKIESNIKGNWLKGSLTGWLAGLLSGFLPGLGSSQTGILASQVLKTKTQEFLIALGGINTSNIFFTFIVFYSIGKTRSGAVWAISRVMETLSATDILLIVVIGVLVTLISAVLTLKISKFMVMKLKHVNYMKLSLAVLFLMVFLVILLGGVYGIVIAVAGTFLGLLATRVGVKRTHLMGFLVLPTILYFSGLDPFLIAALW